MLNLRFVDERHQCASCGCMFVFGAGEQELLYLRGLTRTPTRCPRCVRGGSGKSSPANHPSSFDPERGRRRDTNLPVAAARGDPTTQRP
jgi:Probable zinc-ribbon domain